MNDIAVISENLLDPETPLMSRTKSIIAIIYAKAAELLEEEYEEEQPEFAAWKLLTEEERSLANIESLSVDKQQASITYHNLIDFKVSEIAESLEQSLRSALAEIIMMRNRRLLRFQKLKGYASIKEAARKTIPASPTNSTERQLASFVNNHLDVVEQAGVSEEVAITVMSREPKFSVNAARAISRAKSDEDLGEEERLERVRDIMETAATTQYASDIRRQFLNGHYQIARDQITVGGVQYVTFIPINEDERMILDRRTKDISVPWGNPQPILAETQAARTRQETLNDVRIAIAILEASPASLLSDFEGRLSCDPQEILDFFISFEFVTKTDDYYILTR
jgi:predicted DNA-binding protein YlxM (UPF0122 family)